MKTATMKTATMKTATMKFLFLLEMPSQVLPNKRAKITRELKQLAIEIPKRNVFLVELKDEQKAENLRKDIINYIDVSGKSRISYYRVY
jgi:hypothetical protein